MRTITMLIGCLLLKRGSVESLSVRSSLPTYQLDALAISINN